MRKIAVIFSPESLEEIALIRNLQEYIPVILKRFFLQKLPLTHGLIKLEELDTEVYPIQLPWTVELQNTITDHKILKACRQISSVLQKNGVCDIVIDSSVYIDGKIESHLAPLGSFQFFNGKGLRVECLGNTLKTICKLLGTNLNCVRICVIANVLSKTQIEVLKEICKETRFFSILSFHYEYYMQIVENIYEDTGLVVGLSKDRNNALRESDIIINLSEDSEFVNSCRFPEKAVIINYGAEIKSKKLNGIIIRDLYMYTNRFSLKVCPWGHQLGFCEALLSQERESSYQAAEKKIYKNNTSGLRKLGYKISDFIGLNGKINKSEFLSFMRKYLNS